MQIKEQLDNWRGAITETLSSLRQYRFHILISAGSLCLLLIGVAIAQLAAVYTHEAAQLDRQLNNLSLHLPAGIYAAPRRVGTNQQVTRDELVERLLRAGYQEAAPANDFAVGSIALRENGIEIHTNKFAQTENLPAHVRIIFNSSANRKASQQVASIEDADAQQKLSHIYLPAEMITADVHTKKQSRRAVSYEELPPQLIKALTAFEDRKFFAHRGLDPRGIARAFFKNWQYGANKEGGSTLTQQFIKNHFLSPERTWKRKLTEAMMALALEQRLSKEQILTLYCDRVYLGHSGINEIYGFKQAARVRFGKELAELSLGEIALLVGAIKAPNQQALYNNQDAARARRDLVLKSMVEARHITAAEAAAAQQEELTFLPPAPLDKTAAPHFIDHLNRELVRYQPASDERAHQRIETTLDLDLQQAANEVIQKHLAHLDKIAAKRKSAAPEAALVALDPQTGEILAMVGGRNYATSQLNRVTDAKRQPGSVFKPIVYAAALNSGISPTTTFLDAPQEFEFGYKAVYKPRNFGRSYSNQSVMLREGIIRSLNVVTVDAARQAGLGNVAEFAQRAGLPRPENYPSMALGAFEATPLEVACAYTVFANQGIRTDPLAIRAIVNNGNINKISTRKSGVLPASLAFVVTDTLAEVVNRGTATYIRRAGYTGPVAGKTGTSRDAWFAGYTPKLLVVVWVGFDDNRDLDITGGDAAVPIWASFIKRALELRPDLAAKKFAEPSGLETFEVDPQTGLLANEFCPTRQRLRLPGFMIPMTCYEHNQESAAAREALPEPLNLDEVPALDDRPANSESEHSFSSPADEKGSEKQLTLIKYPH